ncbi:MAG: ATP-dependent helicase RhlE, partial [Actinomycetota bacterium]
ICLPTQKKDLAALLRKASITVTPQAVTADSPAVVKLIGEVAEYVKPAPRVAPQQGGRGPSNSTNGQRTRSQRDRSGRPATTSKVGERPGQSANNFRGSRNTQPTRSIRPQGR